MDENSGRGQGGLKVCNVPEVKEGSFGDVGKGKDVNDEEEGTKHRTLGDTLGDWGGGGFTVVSL